MSFLFFSCTATTEIYTYLHTLSLNDALPISASAHFARFARSARGDRASSASALRPLGPKSKASAAQSNFSVFTAPLSSRASWSRVEMAPKSSTGSARKAASRSEEHTSELQSLMRLSSAVFRLKKKKYYTAETSTALPDTAEQQQEIHTNLYT